MSELLNENWNFGKMVSVARSLTVFHYLNPFLMRLVECVCEHVFILDNKMSAFGRPIQLSE